MAPTDIINLSPYQLRIILNLVISNINNLVVWNSKNKIKYLFYITKSNPHNRNPVPNIIF